MKRKGFLYYFGNVLIILSLLGFAYTFYPIINMYLFPPPPPVKPEKISDGFYLQIPKIHAYSDVIANVDPYNQAAYNTALEKGVAHAKGTVFPGQEGSTFLFAHSSGAPWELTRRNTMFLRLPELTEKDPIILDYKGRRFTYRVTMKKEVWPNEVQYLDNKDNDVLILQTCTPIGTSLRRLLVFAKLVQ